MTVVMYRTLLARELVPLTRGRYAGSVPEVPTTLILGRADAVTKGTASRSSGTFQVRQHAPPARP